MNLLAGNAAADRPSRKADTFLASLLREMRRGSSVAQTTADAQALLRNRLEVCGWTIEHAALGDEADGLDAAMLTRSLALAATSADRTQSQRDRFRLACIDAGTLAMMLGETRPGIE